MQKTVIEQNAELNLVKKAQSGDQQAFQELMSQSRERLRTVIQMRLGKGLRLRLEADDLLQDTTIRALEAIHRFVWQGEGSFERWLQGVAENVILEACRRCGRNPKFGVVEDIPVRDISPSKHMRRSERFERLQEAMRELPADYREVILLARIEGLKVQEIADRMGRTVSSVKNLLLRAMRRLRRSFGETESLHLPARRFDREINGNAEPK